MIFDVLHRVRLWLYVNLAYSLMGCFRFISICIVEVDLPRKPRVYVLNLIHALISVGIKGKYFKDVKL